MRGQGLYPRDLTDAMRETPRQRLYERALRGRWQRFPVSPEPDYQRLANGLGEKYLPKGATFRLERRIEAARDRLQRKTAKDPAARLAAQRALLTSCYRAMGRCDDSFGVIGELAQEALITYAKLPFKPAGLADHDWCEDLCELLVWEEWGLLRRHETQLFAQIRGALADHAETFLLALATELRGQRLPHQADQALENVAYLPQRRRSSDALRQGRQRTRLRPLDADRSPRPGRNRTRPTRHRPRRVRRRRPPRTATRLPTPTLHRVHRLATKPATNQRTALTATPGPRPRTLRRCKRSPRRRRTLPLPTNCGGPASGERGSWTCSNSEVCSSSIVTLLRSPRCLLAAGS